MDAIWIGLGMNLAAWVVMWAMREKVGDTFAHRLPQRGDGLHVGGCMGEQGKARG